MAKMNRCEAEIDNIRLKLYEDIKNMTLEEQIRQINDEGKALAEQYNFKIGKPNNKHKTKAYDT